MPQAALPWLIPAVAGLAGSVIGGIGQRNQNRAATAEQARTQAIIDKWLADYAKYQGDLKGTMAGVDLFGPRTTTSSGTTSSESSSMPVIAAEYKPIAGMLTKRWEDRLSRGSALPPGYRQTQARNIAESFEPAEQTERNALAARGLGVPIASPVARAKATKMADFQAGVPLLERQMETEDLGGAQGLVSALGKGEHATSRGTTSSSTTGPADIGAILQYLGMLAPPQPPIVGRAGQTSPLQAGLSQGMDIFALLRTLGIGGKGGGTPGVAGGNGFFDDNGNWVPTA